MTNRRQQRLKTAAVGFTTAGGQRPECAAVVTLAAGDQEFTTALPGFNGILPCEFDRRLHRFGTAGAEIHMI